MDTQKETGQSAEGYGDESLNTASTGAGSDNNSSHQHHKGGIHNNALYAAGMGRAATAQVDPHSNSGLAQTGTNTSYEGATAAGAGGSAGTGYNSGQADTEASINTDSEYDQAAAGKRHDKADEDGNVSDDDVENTDGQ